ncbi:glutamine--fructose-6-phosphate transaminase (isomerizing) [Propylenella binzhouense]|uniref:Glutamine--fructose-6-phosphate aminotransferase [isomerizing] n=1 Tax=Propylenella binzhouense TaxID=2555902 RepID=A0A964WST8_9HYPH|nr:glutamine--fructose-6-phosphate transaminase (isomerizing) [Propylenella binzhouense]MYZ47317.1 glutamine--fructose-6-phosphate transaminase (isomerizing) [Propylenella binzhouense]
MCGIVGIIGRSPVAPLMVEALRRLEYRGYDSAGVATLESGHLTRRRAQGKLVNLEARLKELPLAGFVGIGHTRWATHGAPNEANAHPHATERVAVVHNGIIENFQALREEIREAGRTLSSDTDTEVIAHLLTLALQRGLSPRDAMAETLGKLQGAFAMAALFEGHDDLLIAARRGSPLAIGHGHDEMYLGSDAIALSPFTDRITYLEDGDWAVITRRSVEIFDEGGRRVERPMTHAVAASLTVDKGNHRHFMLKEIHEQPEVISHTLGHYVDFVTGRTMLPAEAPIDFSRLSRLSISACGTAYYAGLVGKYWFERLARLPVDIDIASEFRYREMPLDPDGLALFVSQSGETADTLASLRYCRKAGQKIAAIVNVPTSTIAREADFVLPTLAGPEIGVASTKAFTCQLSVLFALAVAAGRQRGILSDADEERLVTAAMEVPRLVSQTLKLEGRIEGLAKEIAKVKDVLYLGRGTSFPLAMEGALKLKEISYIHAEGYAAGELKHGPIALIDETLPVIVIAPHDRLFEKTCSNMEEVAARGGRIVLVTDRAGAAATHMATMETIVLPDAAEEVTPLVYAVPVQLIAYHTAVVMGTDVDQPRNLAKSVTVE